MPDGGSTATLEYASPSKDISPAPVKPPESETQESQYAVKDEHPALSAIFRGEAPYAEAATSEQASQKIFDGAYEQLRKGAYGKTVEQQGANFVADIAGGAERHVRPINAENLTNETMFQLIFTKMGKYVMKYRGDPRFESKLAAVSSNFERFTSRLNRLVKSGEVDPLAAKVYARNLDKYKAIGGHNYNALVRNNQDLPPDALVQKNPEYQNTVKALVDVYGDQAFEQGQFIHFNSEKAGDTTKRVYISPNLAGSPDRVLAIWHDALTSTGLQDQIYFKVPVGLMKRHEGIVVYLDDQINPQQVEQLLSTFSISCPPELLSAEPMPTTVSVAPGISIAPEMGEINEFIKFSGKEPGDQISYNDWVASSMQLSFELAYEQSRGANTPLTPAQLKPLASEYFRKIVLLSGLNPVTMMPDPPVPLS